MDHAAVSVPAAAGGHHHHPGEEEVVLVVDIRSLPIRHRADARAAVPAAAADIVVVGAADTEAAEAGNWEGAADNGVAEAAGGNTGDDADTAGSDSSN